MENLAPPEAAEDEISLLDLLLTVSQNIKLLILGPLAAGLCALGITFTLPATYESVAILPTDINSTLRLAAVLDPVIVKLDPCVSDPSNHMLVFCTHVLKNSHLSILLDCSTF